MSAKFPITTLPMTTQRMRIQEEDWLIYLSMVCLRLLSCQLLAIHNDTNWRTLILHCRWTHVSIFFLALITRSQFHYYYTSVNTNHLNNNQPTNQHNSRIIFSLWSLGWAGNCWTQLCTVCAFIGHFSARLAKSKVNGTLKVRTTYLPILYSCAVL